MMGLCAWAYNASPELRSYHDKEWGKPIFDSQKIFELLSLEIFQAGLNWETVLKKRPAFREAFADFDINEIAGFDNAKIAGLLTNKQIIRNPRKIGAVISNAQAVKEMGDQKTFSDYLWEFVDFEPLVNYWQNPEDIPSQTALARKISADLKEKNFKFIGPTIIYSFMQGCGMVNDHLAGCPNK